jgi:hypothetical protein
VYVLLHDDEGQLASLLRTYEGDYSTIVNAITLICFGAVNPPGDSMPVVVSPHDPYEEQMLSDRADTMVFVAENRW